MSELTLIQAKLLWDGIGMPIEQPALVIEDDRIVEIGTQDEIPRQRAWKLVKLPDATLLPGFIDTHVHLADDGWMPLRLLANGITTVRDAGNNSRALLALRARQQRGTWTGPRIVPSGPLLDGAPGHWPHLTLPLTDASNIEQIIDCLAAQGNDRFKAYVRLAPNLVKRVVDRAHALGKSVSLHAGATHVTDALAFGVDCIEHVGSLGADVLSPGAREWAQLEIRSERVERLAHNFLAAKAWLCPTLAVMEAQQYGWGGRFHQFAGYREYPAGLRAYLNPALAGMTDPETWSSEQLATADEGFRRMQALTLALFHAGVPMLAGSDAPWVPVGDGFHYELELLAGAGIPTLDVLAMATSRAARFLGATDTGTLEIGKLADIVAVRGNPVEDIRATSHVQAVWLSGQRQHLALLRVQIDAAAARAVVSDTIPPFGIPLTDVDRALGEG